MEQIRGNHKWRDVTAKEKNSQQGFACCSDSRSVQNVFPFLLWRNADFTCLGIHFLTHFIPEFNSQGIHWIINKPFLNAHYEQGTVPVLRGLRCYPFPKLEQSSQKNWRIPIRVRACRVSQHGCHTEQFHRARTIFTAAMLFTRLKPTPLQTIKLRILFLCEWNLTSLLIS